MERRLSGVEANEMSKDDDKPSIQRRVSEANESRIEVRAIQVLGTEASEASHEVAVAEMVETNAMSESIGA